MQNTVKTSTLCVRTWREIGKRMREIADWVNQQTADSNKRHLIPDLEKSGFKVLKGTHGMHYDFTNSL